MAKQLVRLWERPSYDGRRFRYYLLYTDEQSKLFSHDWVAGSSRFRLSGWG